MAKKNEPKKQPMNEKAKPSVRAIPDSELLKELFPTEIIEEARRVAREQEKRSIGRE